MQTQASAGHKLSEITPAGTESEGCADAAAKCRSHTALPDTASTGGLLHLVSMASCMAQSTRPVIVSPSHVQLYAAHPHILDRRDDGANEHSHSHTYGSGAGACGHGSSSSSCDNISSVVLQLHVDDEANDWITVLGLLSPLHTVRPLLQLVSSQFRMTVLA